MSVVHGQFTLERHYPASPARVFHAFADPATKRRWFADGEGWQVDHYTLDLRPGGHETARFRFGDGTPITNDTVVHDVVAGGGADGAAGREEGSRALLEALAAELARA